MATAKAAATDAPEPWSPPDSDQEFKFESVESIPAWIDPGMRGWSNGPALQLPVGDALFGEGPYTTMTAHLGDTVLFKAATMSKAAHFEVVAGEVEGEYATKRPAVYTNASLEDMLKSGAMTPDDLSEEAKGQVIARSPRLTKLIEEGKGAPKEVAIADYVKT